MQFPGHVRPNSCSGNELGLYRICWLSRKQLILHPYFNTKRCPPTNNTSSDLGVLRHWITPMGVHNAHQSKSPLLTSPRQTMRAAKRRPHFNFVSCVSTRHSRQQM
eukprot:3384156-Amphidinium_carterae.2